MSGMNEIAMIPDKFLRALFDEFDHHATAYRPRRGSAPPEITPDFTS